MSIGAENKEKKLLGTILEEEKRMERLLDGLKEICRIDNRMDLEETSDVDLNTLLPLVISRYPHRDYPEISVDFASDVEGAARVRAAPDRIIQIVTNPVDNSLSYSPEGASVHVRLSKDGRKNTFSIIIEDEGPGFREGSIDFLFNRFYSDRDDETGKNHSGLGLSIVKAIAREIRRRMPA